MNERTEESWCKWENALEHPTFLQNISTVSLRPVTTQAVQLQERFSVLLLIPWKGLAFSFGSWHQN